MAMRNGGARRVITAVVVGLCTLATTTGTTTAVSGPARTDVGAQAKEPGLGRSQAHALQQRADLAWRQSSGREKST